MQFKCVIILAFGILASFFAGCGAEIPQYTEMKNIIDAPSAIKDAARAIVKLQNSNNGGTATFVSADGRLLTNNHVLGISKESPCALEGCEIWLAFDFQKGSTYKPSVKVFAEPLQVTQESDMSVFQIWTDSSKLTKYTPPHFLTVDPLNAKDLVGSEVYVVGHPNLSLKKWTKGKVLKHQGQLIFSTNFALPGNSGSPYLNEKGDIVGILHSGLSSEATVTKTGVLKQSIGTASTELKNILGHPARKHLFYSIDRHHTEEEATDYQRAYFRANRGNALLTDGTQAHLLDLLGRKCDQGLQISDFSTQSHLDKSLASCGQSLQWVSCLSSSADAGSTQSHLKCPRLAEKEAWKERIRKGIELNEQFHSSEIYQWLQLHAKLEETVTAAQSSIQTALDAYLDRANPELSFELAHHLTAFGRTTHSGKFLANFITDYKQQSHYEYHYNAIISGHFSLYNLSCLSFGGLKSSIKEMFEDDKLDVGNRLALESVAYMNDLLE